MTLQHPLLSIGSTPISEDSICGVNAKYELNFESLEAELAKQESLTAEKVDWKEVKALATDLLQNTTKDFLVACYLTHALNITEGYSGLLVGIKILEAFTENYWQESYPPAKRLRARKTAIEWLVEKTTQHIDDTPPSSIDNEVIIELASTVKNLDFALADKMEAQAPSLAELNCSLKRMKQSAEFELNANTQKPAIVEPPAPTTESAAQQAPTPIAPEPITAATPPIAEAAIASSAPSALVSSSQTVVLNNSALANDADAKKLYKQVQDALRQLADFYGEKKPADPKRYLYSRAALWDSLEKLPPNKESKTQLPKPAADKFNKLQELFEQGDFIAVLDQAEKSASKMPYWFDGQRLIANSLSALGGEFTKAAEALISELKLFISRIPNIINLCYSDGTPFADEQTLLWLNTQVLVSEKVSSPDQQKDKIHDAFLSAQKLASAGKLAEGLILLNSIHSDSLRNSFRLKLASAELVVQSGQAKVAIPLLERLIDEAKRINAIDWETDFTIKAYSILVNAYEKLDVDDTEKMQQRKMDAFEQLCWLAPSAVAE